MKNIFIFCLLSLALCQGAIAHSEHSMISEGAALSIAKRAVSKLSFKDLGYNVGKLSKQWSLLKDTDFTLLDSKGNYFLVSATQTDIGKIIYLKITTSGQLISVNENLEQ